MMVLVWLVTVLPSMDIVILLLNRPRLALVMVRLCPNLRRLKGIYQQVRCSLDGEPFSSVGITTIEQHLRP